MTFYKNLYLSEGVSKDADKIVKKIKQNKTVPDAYVIALAQISGDLLDLIPAWQLVQKGYPKDEVYIIGLAKGKKDAISLAQVIIEEVYKTTGGFDVHGYLKAKQEGQV